MLNVFCATVHGAMGCGHESFKLVWRCHQLLSGFLAKRPLAPSVASVTSVANDKVDNEMILGQCTYLLAFALELRKTSARRPSDEGGCATCHCLNWNHFPPNEVGRIAQHVRKGEGRKGWGRFINRFRLL